jgi:acetoin:2,6-dichlorophenolindophenol oxidoreductase subunit alpha
MANTLTKNDLLSIYEKMYTIREFEESVVNNYARGQIPGFVHLYIGEEAVSSGVCAALNKDDYITSTHRGHGHLIAKGGDINKMMAELFAKSTGYCKGKGGSMHISDFDLGIIGSNGIVGAGFSIAAGAGVAAKMRDEGQVCVCFFGDGSTNRGTFHESANMASVFKLPIIYVCENNSYGISACVKDIMHISDIAVRASSYGMPGIKIDGNNAIEVYNTAKSAIELARSGGGPTFIEAITWRHRGHWEGDPNNYRDARECEGWLAKDPIPRLAEYMVSKGIATKDEVTNIENNVVSNIENAVDFAKKSPFPELKELYTDVYA